MKSPEAEVQTLDKDSEQNIFKYFGYTLGFGAALFSLPAALLFMTGGELLSFIEKNQNLNDTKMSDEWLEQVSNSKDVSQEGLAFLAKKLSKQGYITGNDAKAWLAIEEKEAQKRANHRRARDSKKSPGAVALLARAKKECGAMVDVDIISKGLDMVSKVMPEGATKSAFELGRKLFDK